MSKLKNGIMGAITGKLGPVVGATWKGISYLRMAPNKSTIPRSPAQVASQYKFRFLNAFLVPFHSYINHGFKHLAINKTEINVAFTSNWKVAVLGVYPDLSIDYSKVMLSMGTLANISNAKVVRLAANKIELTWDTSIPVYHVAFDDQLMIVFYSPDLAKADGCIGGVKRVAQRHIYTLDEKFRDCYLEVYVVIMASNGKSVSETTYLGRVVAL